MPTKGELQAIALGNKAELAYAMGSFGMVDRKHVIGTEGSPQKARAEVGKHCQLVIVHSGIMIDGDFSANKDHGVNYIVFAPRSMCFV